MIKFKPTESQFDENGECREFLSIRILDGTDVTKVKEHICHEYENVEESIYDVDDDEILIELQDDIEYDFCFNQLVLTAAEAAESEVTWFLLDFNDPTQRMVAIKSA